MATVKNPNQPKGNQLAIYKCSWEVEPGTTRIKFNELSERVLNPGSPDLKTSTLTTASCLSFSLWLIIHSFHNPLFKLVLDYPVVLIQVARLFLQFLHKVFSSAETSITIVRKGCVSCFPQKASFISTLWMSYKLLLEFTVYCLLITCWFLLNPTHQGYTITHSLSKNFL